MSARDGYECDDCGAIFVDPAESSSIETFDVRGENIAERFVELSCPDCGSDAITEIYVCRHCCEAKAVDGSLCAGCGGKPDDPDEDPERKLWEEAMAPVDPEFKEWLLGSKT